MGSHLQPKPYTYLVFFKDLTALPERVKADATEVALFLIKNLDDVFIVAAEFTIDRFGNPIRI